MHDTHLEEGHADDDVDEGDEQNESPVAARHLMLPFFQVMDGKGKQEKATDEKPQEGEL